MFLAGLTAPAQSLKNREKTDIKNTYGCKRCKCKQKPVNPFIEAGKKKNKAVD
jgi:hypothetical protein